LVINYTTRYGPCRNHPVRWLATAVERSTLGIVGRPISTMITVSGYNDVLRIYSNTQRDNIGFRLAYIDTNFNMKLPEPFDQGFMRALFDYDYRRACSGQDRATKPPI
jgi:hypothetical protein